MPQQPPPADPPGLAPLVPEERIVLLDVLRGFALLGILIMNMPAFNMPWTTWAMQPRPFQGGLDRGVDFAMAMLFAGKANAIFSFLFGLGLTVQLRRAGPLGGALVPVYLRRLAALFVIGAAHSVLLWNGDVLHIYAVLGLLLLALRRASDRVIFTFVGVFLLAPIARNAWSLFTQEPPIHPVSHYEAMAHEHIRIYQTGTYAEQVAARLNDLHEGYVEAAPRLLGHLWIAPSFAVTMLLGFWVGRRRILEDVPAHAAWIRRAMFWCLGLGVALAVAFAALRFFRPPPTGQPTLLGFLTGLMFNLNRPLLCLGYIAAIALLFQHPRVRPLLLPLAHAGAMPLTNYLMQSVLATAIFYSYGLGLFARVGPALGLLVVAAIFTVQLLYSRAWLARFRYGPLEWLWRGATYGKLPPLRAR
jgi:uncharacterized protein